MLYTELTTNDSILLHTLNIQQIDSRKDNTIQMYPMDLGHKGMDKNILET